MSPRLSATFAEMSPALVQQGSSSGTAFDVFGEGYGDWVLAALVGIGIDCE